MATDINKGLFSTRSVTVGKCLKGTPWSLESASESSMKSTLGPFSSNTMLDTPHPHALAPQLLGIYPSEK